MRQQYGMDEKIRHRNNSLIYSVANYQVDGKMRKEELFVSLIKKKEDILCLVRRSP